MNNEMIRGVLSEKCFFMLDELEVLLNKYGISVVDKAYFEKIKFFNYVVFIIKLLDGSVFTAEMSDIDRYTMVKAAYDDLVGIEKSIGKGEHAELVLTERFQSVKNRLAGFVELLKLKAESFDDELLGQAEFEFNLLWSSDGSKV